MKEADLLFSFSFFSVTSVTKENEELLAHDALKVVTNMYYTQIFSQLDLSEVLLLPSILHTFLPELKALCLPFSWKVKQRFA